MDGLILVSKPQGVTSHDIVARIRTILNIKKIGHFGTLDPIATGLIVVSVGKATRLFPFFSKTDKVYKGVIRLGYATDTYDSTGKPLSSEAKDYPKKAELLKAMETFEGEFEQMPPPYSAKKFRGKPLYALARRKKEFVLRPSRVNIQAFRLKKYNPPWLEFEAQCSSGTYIRSLAHDLGQTLGCGAHLAELTRIRVGNFRLKDCRTLERIEELNEQGKIMEFLIPLELLLPEYPKIILKEQGSILARNGNLISPEDILKVISDSSLPVSLERENIFRMFSLEGKLLALAKKIPEKNCLHPFLVIDSKEKLE